MKVVISPLLCCAVATYRCLQGCAAPRQRRAPPQAPLCDQGAAATDAALPGLFPQQRSQQQRQPRRTARSSRAGQEPTPCVPGNRQRQHTAAGGQGPGAHPTRGQAQHRDAASVCQQQRQQQPAAVRCVWCSTGGQQQGQVQPTCAWQPQATAAAAGWCIFRPACCHCLPRLSRRRGTAG
jgi:hypothetical protein